MNTIQANVLLTLARIVFDKQMIDHAKLEIAAAQNAVDAEGKPLDGAAKRARVFAALQSVAADIGVSVGAAGLNLLIELVVNWLTAKAAQK